MDAFLLQTTKTITNIKWLTTVKLQPILIADRQKPPQAPVWVTTVASPTRCRECGVWMEASGRIKDTLRTRLHFQCKATRICQAFLQTPHPVGLFSPKAIIYIATTRFRMKLVTPRGTRLLTQRTYGGGIPSLLHECNVIHPPRITPPIRTQQMGFINRKWIRTVLIIRQYQTGTETLWCWITWCTEENPFRNKTRLILTDERRPTRFQGHSVANYRHFQIRTEQNIHRKVASHR